jgi:hypothetical protein
MLAAVKGSFRAMSEVGDREVKVADQSVMAAFQRYRKAQRECKICTPDDSALSWESGFLLIDDDKSDEWTPGMFV